MAQGPLLAPLGIITTSMTDSSARVGINGIVDHVKSDLDDDWHGERRLGNISFCSEVVEGPL